MGFLNRINPTCAELAARLSRGEYEAAPWWVRLGVRVHLLHCDLCTKYARQLRLLGEGFGRSLRAQAAPDVDALRRSLRERLR